VKLVFDLILFSYEECTALFLLTSLLSTAPNVKKVDPEKVVV
tara:strand:+ start:580 stop:705 length:126 start_codon:yes stop_codon:yes gene_type:complete